MKLIAIFLMFTLQLGYNQESPNIIIILTDDQGYGDLSITGNNNFATPNIDRIGLDGAHFRRFYVQPVCSPTRAELLTGQFHTRLGVFGTSAGGERMDSSAITFGQIFKDHGYATAAFGKWHNGGQYPYHPNAKGFDEFYGFCSGHWGNYFSPPLEHNGTTVSGKGFTPDDFTKRAIEFIENHQNSPFLIFLNYNTPHSPMQVPDKWWAAIQEKDIVQFSDHRYSEDKTFTRAALAMCANLDWNIGKIFEKLEVTNLLNNTILVFLSDNGPNSYRWNDGMKGKKGNLDEGGVKSPLLIRYPKKIKPNIKIDQIAGAVDILPTLMDLAQVRLSDELVLDGSSMMDILQGRHWTEEKVVYNHWNDQTSIRTQSYLYKNNGELYDIERDPKQYKNIAADHQDIVEKLSQRLSLWESESIVNKDKFVRPFTVGRLEEPIARLPAADGIAHGNIMRSNKYPNDSFFQNWTSSTDSITWDIEVLHSGRFSVDIYYTADSTVLESSFVLKFADNEKHFRFQESYHSALQGMEHDRVPRIESYVKDFKTFNIGTMFLEKGISQLILKSTELFNQVGPEIKLITLKREN